MISSYLHLASLALVISILMSPTILTPYLAPARAQAWQAESEVSPATGSSRTFYVSVSGSDDHPGSWELPWRTLAYAATRLQAGDTLYIRGGVYTEATQWRASGKSDAPITIRSFPGERVVIDGEDRIPAHTGGRWLFMVWGDWYHVSGLEVTGAYDEGGIGVKGAHVTIADNFVHHNWGAGITMMGDYGLAVNNRVWYNGLGNEFLSRTRGGWPAALTCARYPSHCTLRGNISWENWGEGISTFESYYTTIEDNIAFNNQQNLYISDTKHTLVQRNFVYCTEGNLIDSYVTQNGILVGDEKRNPASSDNRIINNIVYGCDRNLALGTSVSTNSLVANNTFVNAVGETNVLLFDGTCSSCAFFNNLIVQDGRLPIAINGGRGWQFANNLWSKLPPTSMRGLFDQVGNPGLLKEGKPYSAAWFQLVSGSLAIDQGLGTEEIQLDFDGFMRLGDVDIGAFEFAALEVSSNNPASQRPPVVYLPWPFHHENSLDLVDLWRFNTHWHKTGPPGWVPEDINHDGRINALDILLVSARWLKIW